MMAHGPTSVEVAFEMLLEEIEISEKEFAKVLSQAGENGEYDKAREALDQAERIGEFHSRVGDLGREWQSLFGDSYLPEDQNEPSERRNLGRLGRGLRTREDAYYVPILETLIEGAGSGQVQAVLDGVYKKMQGILKDVDLEPLTSDPQLPRWRNAAQWARSSMVRQGLLSSDSPRGKWEITDAGRQFLNNVH